MPDKAAAAEAKARGNAAFSAKDFEPAIAAFTEAIGHDDTDHVFYSNRSACYASVTKYFDALSDAEKCVSIKPEWAKGYSRKGLAEFNLGKIPEALASYKKGLELAPADAALQQGMADVQKAVKAAQARAAAPSGAGGAGGAGGADPIKQALLASMSHPKYAEFCKDKKFEETFQRIMNAPAEIGQQLLMTVIQQDQRFQELLMGGASGGPPQDPRPTPESRNREEVSAPCRAQPAKKEEPDLRSDTQKEADAHKLTANALYKEKQFPEALEAYDKAIAVEPNEVLYYNNKAAVYMEMGEYDKCLEICNDVLTRRYEMNAAMSGGASFEKIAKIYCRMAGCYKKQEMYEDAIKMQDKALTEDNNKQTRNGMRDIERARDKFEAARMLNPEEAAKLKDAANEHFKAQRYAEAKTGYDAAIKRNPTDAKLYSNRAAALTKLGACPDALKDLEETLKLDPKFVKAYSRKGACHMLMKENHKALKAYEDGLKIDPDNEECKKGRINVIQNIQSKQGDAPDEEQVAHAMADPEIQAILSDPQMKLHLQSMQQDPSCIQGLMSDPQVASAINKLAAAGILKMGPAPGGR